MLRKVSDKINSARPQGAHSLRDSVLFPKKLNFQFYNGLIIINLTRCAIKMQGQILND